MATRVLIVESDDVLAQIYSQFLTREGFEVQRAATVDECIKSLHTVTPDVVALEPEVLASSVESSRNTVEIALANLPVIVVTRQYLTDLCIPEQWQVVCLYLKPFSMAQLVRTIRAVANRKPADAGPCQSPTKLMPIVELDPSASADTAATDNRHPTQRSMAGVAWGVISPWEDGD